MANECEFTVKVVAKTKDAAFRFGKVLEGEDGASSLYGVMHAEIYNCSVSAERGYVVLDYVGDVSWNAVSWMEDGRLNSICRELGVGVEVWTQEIGYGIQEHYIVSHNGETVVQDVKHGLKSETDEEHGEVLVGGFEDLFSDSGLDLIYNGRNENGRKEEDC